MDVEVLESGRVDPPTRAELRVLWSRAFDGRFTDDDAAHAYGGVHAMARDRGEIVGHASVVPREIRFGGSEQPWRTVGYVEAVATAPERQGEGIGRQVMSVLQLEIARRWPAALLSTGRATGFYEGLGWERWRGLSFTQTASGVVADDEHGGIMILRCAESFAPDLDAAVTCQDRPGDAW